MGYSRGLAIFAAIPLVNLVGLWLLAFNKWPAVDGNAARSSDQWSSAESDLFKKLQAKR
jgi:hypothetical protein